MTPANATTRADDAPAEQVVALRTCAPAYQGGRIYTPDPAAVERLRALMAQQQPPRWQEAARRQYNGDRIVSHLRQAAQAHAAKVRVVLSDDQMTDIDQRRADGESWAGLARAYGMTQTTLMAAYGRQTHARQTAAKRQE